MSPKDHPDAYFAASAAAAVVNFPLWKASAIAQAGYKAKGGEQQAKQGVSECLHVRAGDGAIHPASPPAPSPLPPPPL